jgi:hypothetical protein
MREEAKALMSDIALDEAQNDDIVSMVTSLKVQLIPNDVMGTTPAWSDRIGPPIPMKISPATAYMLINDLELGVNVPRGTGQKTVLTIEVPEGWDEVNTDTDDHIMGGPLL